MEFLVLTAPRSASASDDFFGTTAVRSREWDFVMKQNKRFQHRTGVEFFIKTFMKLNAFY